MAMRLEPLLHGCSLGEVLAIGPSSAEVDEAVTAFGEIPDEGGDPTEVTVQVAIGCGVGRRAVSEHGNVMQHLRS